MANPPLPHYLPSDRGVDFDRLCELEEAIESVRTEQRAIGAIIVILLLPQVLTLGGIIWKTIVLATIVVVVALIINNSGDLEALPFRRNASAVSEEEDTELLLSNEYAKYANATHIDQCYTAGAYAIRP